MYFIKPIIFYNMKTVKLISSLMFIVAFLSFQSNGQDKQKNSDVYMIVDEIPVYPGGEEALRKDISEAVKYPEEAKKQNISGKVFISFVVDENGKVIDPKIARGVHPLLDKEAIRVMGTLKTWKPGKQSGKVVKVAYTIPINFALNGNSKEEKENNELDENGNLIFRIVEKMPIFPGGEDGLKTYIMQNVKYPEDAKKEGIKGKVYVTFVVGHDGNVSDLKIARGVHPSLDKEALRVIKNSPTWKPGQQKGKVVSVQYTIPIMFALN